MSTTHGQPGLSSDQRSTIRSTILSTRHALEDELRRQLEKYGIYEDKKLPLENLTHLSVEEIETRRTLNAAIERELESTEGDLERSITNYVREATKTYLNRFVALKTIEVRGLVEETVTERPEYGNRSYMHHTVAEIAGELTNASDDGYGAALDLAYQEIGSEIRMIFEKTEHTAINLDAQVREEVLDELDEIHDDAWESDEALGWVYQYFGEEEREEIDDRVDKENYKIAGTDIATKTQLFTPRYIVEWMVDNSLGRTWLEMKGERTNIDNEENCFYLSPLENSLGDREEKSAEDITVFDPACGSGHMLLYSFDVLYQIYLEEGEVPEQYIPREILKNNLFGIDIDTGAAQIAALSLYIKAKEKSPEVTIPQLNIVSADAVLINGDRKQNILSKANSDLEREVIKEIWKNFDNIRERGSLVQIEKRVDEIIEEYRETFDLDGQTQFTPEGEITGQATLVAGEDEETWTELKDRLIESVREIAQAALEHNDPIEEMFAGEVGKTVELLDILLHKYDVVVTNPPYMGSGKMNKHLKSFVKDNYIGSRDLYTAFIERCADFGDTNSYVSMITMESFMYLYSFRKLRKHLLESTSIVELAHLETRDEGYMNTCFVFRPSQENSKSRFIRLINEDNKIESLNNTTKKVRGGNQPRYVFTINQDNFLEIGRHPFIYWFGNELLGFFSTYPALETLAEVKVGLQTSNDERFVRKWWELPKNQVGERFVNYQKSGTDSLYYDFPRDYVDWGDNGAELKNYDASVLRNEGYYFKEGLTVRGFGKHLVARKHSQDMIFNDNKAIFITSDEFPDELLIGILSSSLSRYIMNGINPGLKFQGGDLKRLPIKQKFENREHITDLITEGIQARMALSRLSETSADFTPKEFLDTIKDGINELVFKENLLRSDVRVIHGLVDNIVFTEYKISEEVEQNITEDLPANLSNYKHIADSHRSEHIDESYIDSTSKQVNSKKYDSIVNQLESDNQDDVLELAEKYEISPYTISDAMHSNELYSEDRLSNTVARTLSYLIGELFGRWNQLDEIAAEEEIITLNSDGLLDSAIKEFSDQIYPDKSEPIEILESKLTYEPTDWLRNRFFRYHHVDEYNRRGQVTPIYWQLESPDGAFSCFIYYHEIDANTLPKLRGQYLDPRIDELENELETLNAQTSGDNPNKELLKRKEEVQNNLDDIKEFRETIDEMIDDGVTVDVEKGIWENIKEWDQYEVLETGLPKLKSSYSR